jgi:putative oxygen-independent coproporphyrinogen III oxidase
MPLGLYISIPFCRTKCSYCNFASDVFSHSVFKSYVERLCSDISRSAESTEHMGAVFHREVDSIYLGGGTPTLLDIADIERLFVTISQNFDVPPGAEITVECAPGTLTPGIVDLFQHHGINRVSLGVQSFVDQESRSVGRLHTRVTVLDDITRLRAAGIENINVDLIAGLPYQTAATWNDSISQAIDCGIPHVSIYMLEVDEDSRLGRELMAGGTRYHAHFVADDDLTADLYEIACARLDSVGIRQYEISNFARDRCESRHNLKYWTRQPYVGFGVDAHSMLPAKVDVETQGREGPSLTSCENAVRHNVTGKTASPLGALSLSSRRLLPQAHLPLSFREGFSPRGIRFSLWGPMEAVRFATPESLDRFLSGAPMRPTFVSSTSALEECLFLGLRLNRGVDLSQLAASFGDNALTVFSPAISDFMKQGLIEFDGQTIRLTLRGRLLSNEVFASFVSASTA